MTSREELKKEVNEYIAAVGKLNDENKKLQKQVFFLESEMGKLAQSLDDQKAAHEAALAEARESWRSQAISFGREQCQRAYEDFDAELQNYYALLAQDGQEKGPASWPLTSAFFVRYSYNEALLHKQVQIYKSLSVVHARSLQLIDFDVRDHHVMIRNGTKHDVPLKNYGLHFCNANKTVWLSNVDNLPPTMTLSIWWGSQPSVRYAHELGSTVIDIGAVELPEDEIVQLVHKNHRRKLFVLHSNQCSAYTHLDDDNEDGLPSVLSHDFDGEGRLPHSHKAHTTGTSSSAASSIFLPSVGSDSDHSISSLQRHMLPNFVSVPSPMLPGRNAGALSMYIDFNAESQIGKRSANGELRDMSSQDPHNYSICIRNASTFPVSLNGWVIYASGTPPYTIPLPSHAIIDAKSVLRITANRSDQYARDLSQDVPLAADKHNGIDIPVISQLLIANPPIRSIHLLDGNRINVCQLDENRPLKGVSPLNPQTVESVAADNAATCNIQ